MRVTNGTLAFAAADFVEIVALPPLSYLWPRDRVREYVDLGLKIVLSTEQG